MGDRTALPPAHAGSESGEVPPCQTGGTSASGPDGTPEQFLRRWERECGPAARPPELRCGPSGTSSERRSRSGDGRSVTCPALAILSRRSVVSLRSMT